MSAIAFQVGNRFKVKNEIPEEVYIFQGFEYKNGIPQVHCEDSNGEEVTLEETSLFDLEHC